MLNSSNTNLQDLGTQLASKYQTNKPYPSIYIDDFFDENILEKVLEEFPKVDQLKDKIYYANPNEDKYATKGEYSFGPQTKKLVHFLNSQPFLEFLQKITGIEETLIPDPYFEGGGFHEIKPGGFLKVHVDFHKNKKLQLSRRVNFLVYLNKDAIILKIPMGIITIPPFMTRLNASMKARFFSSTLLQEGIYIVIQN